MKKLLLGLGSIVAVVSPVSAVVACGWNKMEVNDLEAKSSLKEEAFKVAVEKQSDLINVHNKELSLLNDKAATEVRKAAELKTNSAKMNAADKLAAAKTANDAKAARLAATKVELKAIISKAATVAANEVTFNSEVDKATDVTVLRNAIKALIPTTTALINTIGIPVSANVIVKGLPMLSLTFNDKTKILVITARYVDGLKVISLSHNIKMTFS